VQLASPAVRARCEGAKLPLGERVSVRLEMADPDKRQVQFSLA
jgi:exoribonuclease R